MAKKHYELVSHVFKGGRFDDHGIDVDVLPDLIAYKNLLIETAKSIWRRKHPDRQRLPKNFEESLSIKFYDIRPGSAAIPLMREVEMDESLLQFEPTPDELDEAVELVTDTVNAVSADHALPESFPKNVIPLFADYGKTLRSDESFEHRPAKRRTVASYSPRERDCLIRLAEAGYEDVVDLVGEIRAADLDGGNFTLRLADSTKIPGKFLPDQETVITDALREHVSRWLHIRGRAEFHADRKLKRVVSVTALAVQPAGATPYDESARPIWEIIEEIGASVPEEEWAKVPSDGAKNLDHYLYGHVKKN